MLQGARHAHVQALDSAANELNIPLQIFELRKDNDLLEANPDAIILPGGESSTMRLIGNGTNSQLLPSDDSKIVFAYFGQANPWKGIDQIIKVSGIPKSEFKEVNNKDLPKSKIIKKEIFKKESKKGTAIRKFLFWKSNKEKSSDYPSYLCYYLDYSEGRSDPIKRKLYPFEDEKLGLGHLKKLIDENIKKGWEKHNG